MHPRLTEKVAHEHAADLRRGLDAGRVIVLSEATAPHRPRRSTMRSSRVGRTPAVRRSMGLVLVRLGSRLGGLESV